MMKIFFILLVIFAFCDKSWATVLGAVFWITGFITVMEWLFGP